jgi:AcrR family transcriptional regulator
LSSYDAILDAAERVFGTHGYDGASMREIAEFAGVAQALLHYHFKNKEALYTAVFQRRSGQITGYRRQKLAGLFREKAKPQLEDIFAIVLTPLTDIFPGPKRGNAYYLQMVSEVTLANNERSQKIVQTFFDPIGEEIIAAMQRAEPGLPKERAVWAYLFTVGARQQAHALNGRAARLMGNTRSSSDTPHSLLVPFVAGGIRALAAATKGGSHKAPRKSKVPA